MDISTFQKLVNSSSDVNTFQKLVLRLIPENIVSDEVLEKVITCIILMHKKNENYLKIESLFIWISSLLDYHMINLNAIDKFYNLIFGFLDQFPKCVSHIMYLLTKPYDVVLWRIIKIQNMIEMHGPKAYLCILLNRFKEYNSEFSHISIPMYKKTAKIFSHKSQFCKDLRRALSHHTNLLNIAPTGSIIMPFTKQKKSIRNNEEILPETQYLHEDFQISTAEFRIHDIKTGTEFFRNFQNIILPSHTLSLLKSTIGLRVLMFSDTNIQEHFMCNLHAVLVQNFIYHKSSDSKEMENLLNIVIHLHFVYQQGFIQISSFLALYLQFWEGCQYKTQIYKLLEWFVFKSLTELNRFLLKPLHTLFISSDAGEMCDIILCLTNLIINLYSIVARRNREIPNLLEEDILKNVDELIPVIKSLSKFVSELCKLGLYIYPCNSQILIIAVMFYEKMFYLERLYNVSFWTTISSNVLYHTLFGCNAQILNQVCALILNYPVPLPDATPKIKEQISRLQSYVQDIINFLWNSTAFQDRTMGRIFRNLTVADSTSWENYVNLNNSLDIVRHVMFEPYRSLKIRERNTARRCKSKEEVLELLRPHVLYIVELIETFFAAEAKQSRGKCHA